MKKYIVVGDNNYWYATFSSSSERAAMKRFTTIKKEITNGERGGFDVDEVAEVYLFEAKEIAREDMEEDEEEDVDGDGEEVSN